jgi:asparagine synthase (glutamine-hydrolysing)
MVSERGKGGEGLVAVVFNGCIYNHRDLRRELQAAGRMFQTDHSDTEVLIHGWREWKDTLWDRLDGMFAAAIWDRDSSELTIGRDPLGEKPLYTCMSRDGSIEGISSCAGGLYALGMNGSSSLDLGRLVPWIRFGWNAHQTPLPGVEEAPIGSARRIGGPRTTTWFATWPHDTLNPSGVTLNPDRAEELLELAVVSRLVADVPVGVFLSAGIDSALVSLFARRASPEISAFTVRMPDRHLDESEGAAKTAKTLGIRHEILDCHPRPAEDLVALIQQVGLPFGDSSLLPSTWVSRAASSAVKVALSGDGGDELFLGYDRHKAIALLNTLGRLPSAARRVIGNAATPLTASNNKALSRIARLLNAAGHRGYKDLLTLFPAPMDARLGLPDPLSGDSMHWGLTTGGDLGEATALRFDRLFYLPCDLLRKTDTASMSVPLEVRAPILQRDLARAAFNAPIASLMPHNQRKGLLRQIARKYLPADIVDRPKQGFAIPIGEWFRSDYGGMKQLLMDHLNSAEPWGPPRLGIDLNMAFVRRMLDEHMDRKRDHSQRLYMLLVLSIWAKWLGSLR